ncbi:16S rRNA m(2)G 1207 methyltransferase [Stackebrandtia endophytica]|uniref:16S rRNA m(2)G 1207 methyltransferase n=1 Tax=Stackebrandtia endophytica TaxID=1496996 RepID=A0A543B060_9ACTN|nr:16S rRNA m(2)G 1207 methyltransferase [Stackebrandtia endophytica]
MAHNDEVTESEHYFATRPNSQAKPRTIDFEAAGRQISLRTDSGVFSASRLDPGTAVLLRKAPLPTRPGRYLDLGCGYGPIAVSLGLASQGSVTAVDVNTRALELVRSNAAELGVEVTATTPEEVPADARFDQIWSNPPIRVGKAALHELLEQWLPRLAPDGVAWLVVARHKGADSLVDWLTERGFPTVKHASQKGYRVLRVERA